MTLTQEPVLVAEAVEPGSESDYELERDKPMPSFNHGLVQANIIFALKQAYGRTHTVVAEVTLETDPVSVPDVALYPKRHPDWLHDEVRVAEIPLLVVEILSPSQSVTELMEKAQRYFQAGVRSYWMAIPTHRIIAVHNPGVPPTVFTTGPITDPASEISVTIEDIYE